MVSIIVVTYNRSHYLKVCIESILNQTFKKFEVVIVDDGSSDNTKKVVDAFNDNRLIYYNYGRIGNVSILRNLGFAKCNFEVIAFCDDDDLWVKNKLERQLAYINRYSFICTNSDVVDQNGNVILDKYYFKDQSFEIDLNTLLNGNYILTPSVLFKKEIIKTENLFDNNFTANYCEDYNLWLGILETTKCFFLNEILIHVRRDTAVKSLSQNKAKMYINYLQILKRYTCLPWGKNTRYAAKKGVVDFNILLLKLYFGQKEFASFLKQFFKLVILFWKIEYIFISWSIILHKIYQIKLYNSKKF